MVYVLIGVLIASLVAVIAMWVRYSRKNPSQNTDPEVSMDTRMKVCIIEKSNYKYLCVVETGDFVYIGGNAWGIYLKGTVYMGTNTKKFSQFADEHNMHIVPQPRKFKPRWS
jgi:hypothetical protein